MDRIDPTEVALKMIYVGIESRIVKFVIIFLGERKMELKRNGQTSTPIDLVWGGPQESLIGKLLYIIASDDVAEEIPEEDKIKYIDDVAAVEEQFAKGNLVDYDVLQHVPSDVRGNGPTISATDYI